MGPFFGWISSSLCFPLQLCVKSYASTIEGVARRQQWVAGRGLVCLKELCQNSKHILSLTRSLSPQASSWKPNSYIHLLFPDKEKRQPSLLHTNETHLCYLPSLWELETFLHSAHPSNMLWSFLSLSWNRLCSARCGWVHVVGLARGQQRAGPLVRPDTRNGSYLPLVVVPSSCGPSCSCAACMLSSWAPALLLSCAPCCSQCALFWPSR